MIGSHARQSVGCSTSRPTTHALASVATKKRTMQSLTDEERQNLRGSLTTLRIIVAALIMGVLSYLGYCLYIHLGGQAPARPQPAAAGQLSLPQAIAIGFASIAAVLSFLVPPFIPKIPVETTQTDQRAIAIVSAANTVQVRTIVASALLEGAAFFNAVYVQTDFSLPNLAMVGVLLLIMASHFPLSGWYFDKVERIMGV